MNKEKSKEIINILKIIIDNPRCELDYNNPFELLIATILSAQTKDIRVNMVTPFLFNKYPNPCDLANGDIKEVETIIAPLGLAHMKAKNIINVSKELFLKYNSIVPNTIEELIKLPGVGRKTASVILVEAFKIPAIPVDTHVLRIAKRLGYTKSDNPTIVENDLKKYIPIDDWIISHHLFIHFGRYKCMGKNPLCDGCKLIKYCNEKIKTE